MKIRVYIKCFAAAILCVAGNVAGGATHYVNLSSPGPTPPFTNWATAATNIQDAVDAAAAGDEVLVTNGVYETGGRAAGTNTLANRVAVDKPLVLRSVNGPEFTFIQGHQVPATTNGDGAIRCVYLATGASLCGFMLTNGGTLSDYVPLHPDGSGGGLWCEDERATASNCLFEANSAVLFGGGAHGGTLNNRTLTGNSAQYGGGADGSVLNNCTLTDNSAYLGGGVASVPYLGESATLNHCTLSGNRASLAGGGTAFSTLNGCTLTGNSAEYGGGAHLCTLNNCTLTGNSAQSGGGAYDSFLENCTVTGNSAASGGGVEGDEVFFRSTLRNCIVYFNTAVKGANYSNDNLDAYLIPTFSFCCTMPMPTNGVRNITNAPLFVDMGGGNLRLQSNSPCINAGNNTYAPAGPDLDGNSRIVGGTVDIGAYEFQSPTSTISYAWLQQYGFPADGSADFSDPDDDQLNNWQEWRSGTDPTSALSALRMVSARPTGAKVSVTWQSVAGMNYSLMRSTNLTPPVVFTPVATNIIGQADITTFTDTNTVGSGAVFYRAGIEN